jgi:DNA-binding NtrC family response regulator
LTKHGGDRKWKITRAALDKLTSFSWPGNVRQLENEIRRAVVLASHDRLDVTELSADVARGGPESTREAGHDLRSRVDQLEADMLRDALEKTAGNQTRAAQMLGLSRFGLQKMMKRLRVASK